MLKWETEEHIWVEKVLFIARKKTDSTKERGCDVKLVTQQLKWVRNLTSCQGRNHVVTQVTKITERLN